MRCKNFFEKLLQKVLTFGRPYVIIYVSEGNRDKYDGRCQEGEYMSEDMTRLELLTVMLAIKALLESGNVEKAKELIDEVIAEAKRKGSDN